jgi:hypothetical protein
MSLMIETTEELLALLKKMDLKVTSVDELQHLLATINANDNPEATRQKTGRQIGTVVPGAMAGGAAFASFMLLGQGVSAFTIGGLAVVWGAVAIVSTAAVIAGAVLSGVHRSRTLPETPPNRSASRQGPMVTHITKDLSI